MSTTYQRKHVPSICSVKLYVGGSSIWICWMLNAESGTHNGHENEKRTVFEFPIIIISVILIIRLEENENVI